MGAPLPVLEAYLGFMQDIPRHELPPGIVWDLVNVIPNLDGAARRRGGFQPLYSQTFSQMNAAATATGAGVWYCPFATVAHEVLAGNGQGYYFSYQEPSFGGSSLGQQAAGAQPKARGIWHRDQLVIPLVGTNAIIYKGRVAGFTAPTTAHGGVGTLWGDYSVLANDGISFQQRVWFSAAGDPTTWDTTNSWIDIPGVVKGVEGTKGALLIWTDHELWRITGTTPPQSTVVGDLVLKSFADTGLADERSIASYGAWVIYANAEGVWRTDGASAPVNLTVAGGINKYWRSAMAGYNITATDFIVAGGIYKGYYLVSILSVNAGVNVWLACDLSTNRWFRLNSSLGTMAMTAHGVSGHEDLYFVSASTGQKNVMGVASAFEQSSTTDWDGSSLVIPTIETPMFRGWQHWHRKWIPSDATSVWQRLYANLEAPQYAALANALRVQYTTDPEVGGAYTLAGYLPFQTALGRPRMVINPNGGGIASRQIGFKIDQVAGTAYSNDLRIGDLELEYWTREGNR